MEFLTVLFPVSGVKTHIFIPPLVSMIISFFTSMGGVSGAFLLLPFQVGVLGYTAPSVSGTNHVFNTVATPSGVYRYIKEGRMVWPITLVISLGTLPGVFLGYYLRVVHLRQPKSFKFFVGCVLLYIGFRLFKELFWRDKALKTSNASKVSMISKEAIVKTIHASIKKIEYEFLGERFSFNPIVLFMLSLAVGVIGGVYGIGGGAIIAPFCVTVLRLPVHTIAGATLMGTFITSLSGAIFFSFIDIPKGVSATPDWALGILFGIGGLIGMYLGARTQKFVPQRAIKLMLAGVILFLAIKYIYQYF